MTDSPDDDATVAALETDDVLGAYVADHDAPPEEIPAERITHLYYAFAGVADGRIDVDGDRIDALVGLKDRNPDLQVLVSVGGWGASEEFEGLAATAERRERYADSVVECLREHGLDGIDYDWEFPAADEAEEFTAMVRTLRERLDAAGEADDRDYLLTSALSTHPDHLVGVDLGVVHEYLDLVNAMTYDMQPDDRSHHTNLFTSERNERFSVADTVERYRAAGVPPEKLVVGVGAYSRGSDVVGYDELAADYVDADGWERGWDDEAKAPYLERDGEFLSYDDPESVRRKVDYLRESELRGVMYWEYGHDRNHELLDTMFDALAETADPAQR